MGEKGLAIGLDLAQTVFKVILWLRHLWEWCHSFPQLDNLWAHGGDPCLVCCESDGGECRTEHRVALDVAIRCEPVVALPDQICGTMKLVLLARLVLGLHSFASSTTVRTFPSCHRDPSPPCRVLPKDPWPRLKAPPHIAPSKPRHVQLTCSATRRSPSVFSRQRLLHSLHNATKVQALRFQPMPPHRSKAGWPMASMRARTLKAPSTSGYGVWCHQISDHELTRCMRHSYHSDQQLPIPSSIFRM
jgi:hypothetical protein